MTENIRLPHAEILSKISKPLLNYYSEQRRILPWRENPNSYYVWISEIMLQQTRVAAVLPYFERFLKSLPNMQALAECDEDTLMKLWQGLGYYNRARNLQKTAKILVAEHDGKLPEDFDALLALPGIGRYTAAAISSIAYGHCHPAVDGNVLRVITRLLSCPWDILKDKTKRIIENELQKVYPKSSAGDMNQALMELGATICLPNGVPLCEKCPLRSLCLACKEQRTQEFPQKQTKKKRRIEKLTILLIEHGENIAIKKRSPKGLLAGLWELPHLSGHHSLMDVNHWLLNNHLQADSISRLPSAKHIFSHVEWDMIGWKIHLKDFHIAESRSPYGSTSSENVLHFASRDELAEKYSIPSAFQYFFPAES